jgi:hypothetical protein
MCLVPLLSLLCTFGSYYALNGRSPALEDVYTVIALFKLLVLPFKTCSEGKRTYTGTKHRQRQSTYCLSTYS